MEVFYWGVFSALAALVGVLVWNDNSAGGGVVSEIGHQATAFKGFRNNYIVVFALMMAGDWLQGPYVYALYQYYGFGVQDIGRLFIAGFASSMIFGTIVGSMADKYGRKNAALLYVVLYVLSCVTKHSSSFWVLMVGRLLGGIATSLLFSVFEAWVVSEHFSKGFPEKWIGDTFSKAVFVGNGLVAIVAGLVANYLVDNMGFGPVAPFDLAIIVLTIGGGVIAMTWTENYGGGGDQKGAESRSMVQQFKAAFKAISEDPCIGLLGAMQSLFEAGMYSFVFLWTPALSSRGELLPHGFIFACFMTACMAGSSCVPALMKTKRPEAYMQYVFGLAAAALAVPAICHLAFGHLDPIESVEDFGITLSGKIQLVAFLVFEVCVGIFWPSMMTMRARYVPEELRATIMNCFRIPLNLFVCLVLYNVSLVPIWAMFALCTLFMAVATACQLRLTYMASPEATVEQSNVEEQLIPSVSAKEAP